MSEFRAICTAHPEHEIKVDKWIKGKPYRNFYRSDGVIELDEITYCTHRRDNYSLECGSPIRIEEIKP